MCEYCEGIEGMEIGYRCACCGADSLGYVRIDYCPMCGRDLRGDSK